MTTVRDAVVRRALQQVEAPDHAPGFWDRLDERLGGSPAAGVAAGTDGGAEAAPSVVADLPLKPRREPVGRILVAAAALVLVVATAGLAAKNRGAGVQVGPPATAPAPSPATSPTTPPPSPEESAVLQFVDALGAGDLAGAARHLGPRSEAYIEATAGSVEAFLAQAGDGYRAWASAQGRSTQVIAIRPGDEVVVLTGRVMVDGALKDRVEAVPVRHAESAGAWFVEPWAFDPATGGRLELVSPAGGGSPNRVALGVPAPGTAWLSVDGAPAQQVAAGPDRTAGWNVTPGHHDLVLAFVNDTTFSALATPFVAG